MIEISFIWCLIAAFVSFLAGRWTARLIKSKNKRHESSTDSTFADSQQLISQVREIVQYQILNNQPQLFSAIAKQKTILNDNRRTAIAIFLSPPMFKQLMHDSNPSYAVETVDTFYDLIRDLHIPVGFLGDLPIHISELMTSAPVFVVGEISWSFNG